MLVARETIPIIFDNDYVEVSQDAALQAIVLVYKRQGTSVEFRDLQYRLLEIFEKTRRYKLLIDAREMGVVAPDDQRWLGQYILPQLATHTLNQFLYIAVVSPDKVFTKLAVDNIEQLSVETGTCLNKHFDNPMAARLWLQEQSPLLP